ncbi:7-cyano-7-deazaguanine synthase [Brevibacterium ravenspurgense]|uniref:7-cyano-7-deazaguanine synthase n=2 Tax=Brevibacterium ravenspurgense TaxID=479117 RepID=A0A150H5W2_9MICO|nr:7-cyano-7-deazaguanine synthase [Brevibacterium ravenspurgense]
MYSGGPDSTTLLFDLIEQGIEVDALFLNFDEKGGDFARSVAAKFAGQIAFHEYDIAPFMRNFYGLPQPMLMRKAQGFGMCLEEDPYVQPFGSAIALTLAASWAVKHGSRDVYYAVHDGDSHFQDNNRSYFELLSDLTRSCEGEQYEINFQTPYLGMTKAEVISRGEMLGVDFEQTWSCAHTEDIHCGECPPCIDRRMAFRLAEVVDPVQYASDLTGVK